MIRGPSFIVSTMQEETTPIFKRLWYDWTQQQPGIEPTNPLGQCWVPPIVAFYDQQGLLRTYSLPGGSIRSPHPGSPRGSREREETEVNNLKEESLLKQSSAFKVSESTVGCGTNIAIFHFSENGKHMGEREKTELKKLNQESIAKESSSLPASERVIFATMDRVR